MLKAVQHKLRRLGFVSALLLALAMVMPVPQAEARAVEADSFCAAVTVTVIDDCGDAECQDCLVGCIHNCCHGPHPALAASLTARLVKADGQAPSAMDAAVGAPLSRPDGPDHPPRG
jgi:hypothetical protein